MDTYIAIDIAVVPIIDIAMVMNIMVVWLAFFHAHRCVVCANVSRVVGNVGLGIIVIGDGVSPVGSRFVVIGVGG